MRILWGVLIFLMSMEYSHASNNFIFNKTDNAASKYFYVPTVARPAGAKTQWMSFYFYSTNFFKNSPNSHFAAAIRGKISSSSASGRGITLGHTHLIPNDPKDPNRGGCDEYRSLPDGFRPGMSQIESFWPGGNYVYAKTCRPFAGYEDGKWYKVTIHVNDTPYIAYWIDDQAGNRIDAGYEPAVLDSNNPVPSNLTGVWIAFARGPNESGDWKVQFYQIQYGWF